MFNGLKLPEAMKLFNGRQRPTDGQVINIKAEKPKEEDRQVFLQLENDVMATDTKSTELENFWTDIHALVRGVGAKYLKKGQTPKFTFEVLSDGEGARFYMGVPERYKNVIMKKLNAVYPYIEIEEVKDPLADFDKLAPDDVVTGYELVLAKDHNLPLKMKNAEKTFLNSLINSMNHFGEGDVSVVQVTIKTEDVKRWWQRGNKRKSPNTKDMSPGAKLAFKGPFMLIRLLLLVIVYGGDFLTGGKWSAKGGGRSGLKEVAATKAELEFMTHTQEKAEKPTFQVAIRVASKSKDPLVSDDTARSIAAVFRELDYQNTLQPVKVNIGTIRDREDGTNKFCVAEISQFAYLPNKNTNADNVMKGGIKQLYDKNIPSKGLVFGESNGKPVAFPMEVISQTTYEKMYKSIDKIIDNICKPRLILGQMGTGKSEFIINYVLSAIEMGVSVIVVDPKHDTQKRLIESIPEKYMHLVDYIDLGDLTFPAAMNLLRLRTPGDQTEISMVTQTFINFMKKLYGNAWGYSMQLLIQNVVNTILLMEIHTLYEFQLILTNKEYRQKVIDHMKNLLKDEKVKGKAMIQECLEFWEPFHKMSDKDQYDRIKSTMNRIGLFMANRLIRAIVSQRESYDFRKAGDLGRITIINISEGILGPENTAIMSSFINKAIWLDFQSRADQPDMAKRYPCLWLIDEAHTIVDEEFVGILTKSRAYRLGVTLITQGLSNFKHSKAEGLDELILTNCKNKILFRLGPLDAKLMADEFQPLSMFDLSNIPDYHFYAKILLEGGVVSDPFYCKAPLPAKVLRNYEEYINTHRTGKMTIDEVEDDTRLRHKLQNHTTMFSGAIGLQMEEEEDNKPTRKGKKQQGVLDKIS